MIASSKKNSFYNLFQSWCGVAFLAPIKWELREKMIRGGNKNYVCIIKCYIQATQQVHIPKNTCDILAYVNHDWHSDQTTSEIWFGGYDNQIYQQKNTWQSVPLVL